MGRQESIPGTELPEIAEIQEAAEFYESARDERIAAGKEEIERRTALIMAMNAHKRTTYRGKDGLTVELVAGEQKVKVSRSDGKGAVDL